jgi:hypothetical protein
MKKTALLTILLGAVFAAPLPAVAQVNIPHGCAVRPSLAR